MEGIYMAGTGTLFHLFPNLYFVDLCLYQTGYERCDPGHFYDPFVWKQYLFHYVLSRKGTFCVIDQHNEEKIYEVHGGQGFLIFPGQLTHYHADMEDPWEYTWIEFNGVRVEEVLMNCNMSITSPIYRPVNTYFPSKLRNTMLEMAFPEKSSTDFYSIGDLYKCMDYLIRSSQGISSVSEKTPLDAYIKKATRFIEQNFHKNISIEDIASHCNISRSYLDRITKQQTGQSPQELLFKYRMSKAAQLLRLTSLSVKQIGREVGYPDQLRFSRAFRKAYGLPPSQWRAQETAKKNIP